MTEEITSSGRARNNKTVVADRDHHDDDIEKAPWTETFLGGVAYVIFFLFVSISDLFIGVFGVEPTADEGPERAGVGPERPFLRQVSPQNWEAVLGGYPELHIGPTLDGAGVQQGSACGGMPGLCLWGGVKGARRGNPRSACPPIAFGAVCLAVLFSFL